MNLFNFGQLKVWPVATAPGSDADLHADSVTLRAKLKRNAHGREISSSDSRYQVWRS